MKSAAAISRICLAATLLVSAPFIRQTQANGPPVHSETAFVVGLQGAALRSFLKEISKSRLLQNGNRTPDPMSRRMRAWTVPVVVPYEVIPNQLVLGAMVPYWDKKMELTQSGIRKTLSNSGLGDAVIFGKYQLYQRDRGPRTTRITGKLSLKLPTAKDDAKDAAGALLPLGLQLGSGAADVSFGGILTQLWKRFGINGGLHYTFKTKANSIELGDVLKYDLAFAYRILPKVYEVYPTPQWNIFMEFNGSLEQKRKESGQFVSNSGGNTVFLSPGIQFIGGRSWLLELSYQMPVIQDLNGTQLGTDRTFLAGFRWLIL